MKLKLKRGCSNRRTVKCFVIATNDFVMILKKKKKKFFGSQILNDKKKKKKLSFLNGSDDKGLILSSNSKELIKRLILL